jgi:thiamine-phosphate pyrophosphorylase
MLFPHRLYPITDRGISGRSHALQVEALSRGGARIIQLREKHLSPRDFLAEAEAAFRTARANGARLIVNDRLDLALALGADGVHLGQTDLPPIAARRLLGEDAIIGYSTHSLSQAEAAALMPVDYIAIGPIFPTSSKANPEEVVGLEALQRVRDATGSIPLVAIGGITEANASGVLQAGADAVAMISTLLVNPEAIERQTASLISLLGRSQTNS